MWLSTKPPKPQKSFCGYPRLEPKWLRSVVVVALAVAVAAAVAV